MAESPRRPLTFRDDGTFTLVQFTDLHWKDGGASDARTAALMEAVLESEPAIDLVVMTGDILGGHKVEDPPAAWLEAVAPMEARGIPWCAVFGNHDDEASASREDLIAVQLEECRHCLTQRGPRDVPGVGNYVLGVASRDGHDPHALTLYFLDSHAYAPWRTVGGYAWVRPAQMAWFRAEARRVRALRPEPAQPAPSLAFFHIPLPEYAELAGSGLALGDAHEAVCCPRINSGLFETFRQQGDVMGVFVGHDHVNDFEGDWHGIRLCYGRQTGFNTYGKEGFPRGARVVRCREGERGFETWLRVAEPDGGVPGIVHRWP